MMRVAAEVRIYPVFPMGSGPLLDLGPLETRLADQGITTGLVDVDDRFQRRKAVMLTCRA